MLGLGESSQQIYLALIVPTANVPLPSRAADIATSWRISNDIQNDWNSIWRITNQVVPYFKHTQVGAYPDMDMLM